FEGERPRREAGVAQRLGTPRGHRGVTRRPLGRRDGAGAGSGPVRETVLLAKDRAGSAQASHPPASAGRRTVSLRNLNAPTTRTGRGGTGIDTRSSRL